jgi:hypothetical protein
VGALAAGKRLGELEELLLPARAEHELGASASELLGDRPPEAPGRPTDQDSLTVELHGTKL